MKFSYQNSIYLNTDVASVWSAITNADFVRDFLPEIRRSQSSGMGLTESINDQLLRWRATDDIKINLTRADLNVAISSIEIRLKPLRKGLTVTIRVDYEKRFESNFVKAHMAVRGLFKQKLRVLKADFKPMERELAFR
ncbi:MAG: hypothetical protein KTR32_07065 [Granulosicoccus sp.]|nr:hypothetical protein [Granulosicoccus sp.]